MITFMRSERISALVGSIAALLLASCSGKETASEDHRDGLAAHWPLITGDF